MSLATKEVNTIPVTAHAAVQVTSLLKTRVRDFDLNFDLAYEDPDSLTSEDYWGNYDFSEQLAAGRTSFHKDHLGSTTVVTDETGDYIVEDVGGYIIGTQPELTQYRPYGQPRAGSALNTITDYNFTDQEWDRSTGLYNYDARLYNPEIAMFITADSMLPDVYDPQQLNRYAYTRNNPINYIDPDGHDAVPVVFKNYLVEFKGQRLPHLGHAGVLLIDNKTGYTKYYEYGRYPNPNDDDDKGIVRNYEVSNVTIDKKTGMPTVASLAKVLTQISAKSGQPGKGRIISGAYIKNDNFEEMNEYAQERLEQNSDPNREPYDKVSNQCATFMKETVEAGGVDMPTMIDPTPNSYIDEIQDNFSGFTFNPTDYQKVSVDDGLLSTSDVKHEYVYVGN